VPSLHLTFDRTPRFVVLLVGILAELMVAPLFSRSDIGLHAAQITTSLILIAALWAVGAQGASVGLFVVAIIAHLVDSYWGGAAVHVVALALRVVFLSYATALIVRRIMTRPDVTMDTIAGAACAYTMLALVWGNAYVLLEFLRPDSFVIPAAWRVGASGEPTVALIYFSFITLTTVGYGDIAPQWPGAGGLAAAEAIVGQLYLGITIARLVGLHISQRT